MCDELTLAHYLYNINILSFVLMPNHFHLLAQTPEANLSDAMRYFMCSTSKAINVRAHKINQNHGSRYFRCLIKKEIYFQNVYKYVYRNPVTAGLSKTVEAYRYSSIQMYLGLQTIKVPLSSDEQLMSYTYKTLSWLNLSPQLEDITSIKRALKRGEFKLAADLKSRRKNRLENNFI
ncbi:MAG: hypothetical protein A2Z20_05800 [Bdellovibrionales bacterium RBG_16_40_8]|nr:MAG: hypothetical protein A2Z20_05800 [Bdellovibrionales bacterium RBG_16_40_8]